MIPSDHIKFSDDGKTAWWLPGHQDLFKRSPHLLKVHVKNLDRPCSTCHGDGVIPTTPPCKKHANWHPWCPCESPCPDCHGSGRHCFEIVAEAEQPPPQDRTLTRPLLTLTVSVVPGMVLPIVEPINPPPPGPPRIEMYGGYFDLFRPDGGFLTSITLPSAAAPGKGMFAVKLEVHR